MNNDSTTKDLEAMKDELDWMLFYDNIEDRPQLVHHLALLKRHINNIEDNLNLIQKG